MISRYAPLGVMLAALIAGPALAQSGYAPKPRPVDHSYGPAGRPGAPAKYGPASGGYGGQSSTDTDDLPPNAHPGQCFAHILTPLRKETHFEDIIDVAEHTDIKVIPAVYETIEKDFCIREERTDLITIPATYKTITETVVIRPEMVKKITIPAVYETKSERVMIHDSYTTWKRGVGLLTRVGMKTKVSRSGDILCLVTVPAEYKLVSRQLLVKPEETREETVPAITREVTRSVLDTAARVEKRVTPAVYKKVAVRQLVTPERTETITVPATYKKVERTVVIGGGKFEWREILCDTNTTPDIIIRVQTALERKGYFHGKKTGVFGPQSWEALRAFQHDQGLPEGQLTIETVKVLEVSY